MTRPQYYQKILYIVPVIWRLFWSSALMCHRASLPTSQSCYSSLPRLEEQLRTFQFPWLSFHIRERFPPFSLYLSHQILLKKNTCAKDENLYYQLIISWPFSTYARFPTGWPHFTTLICTVIKCRIFCGRIHSDRLRWPLFFALVW